jgi:hypothetical protein
MNLDRIKKVSLGVILALNVTVLSANVTVVKEHDAVDTNKQSTFSQVGISGERAEKIKGFGKNMPFGIAMDIIVPEGWDITNNKGAESVVVEWEGNMSWPYVLKDLSEKNDISVSVNWLHKTVDLFSHTANREMLEDKALIEEKIRKEETKQEEIRKELLLAHEKELREKFELEKQQAVAALKDQVDASKSKDEYIISLEKEKDLLEKSINESLAKIENIESNVEEKSSDNIKIVLDNSNSNDIKLKEFELENEILIEKENKLTDEQIRLYTIDYNERVILPIEPSVDFFVNGGYKQKFDYLTPATYIIKDNSTVKEVLESWGDVLGLNVKYKTRVHYEIEYGMTMEGDFTQVSAKLMSLYKESTRPLKIDLYPKQNLIIVKDLSFK